MKTILVTGSSGFIGTHLVKRLQDQGHYVIGADIEPPKYHKPDKFFHYDLRVEYLCYKIFTPNKLTDSYEKIDEVYNLACLMGGMGYIGDSKHNYDIMIGSTQIVMNILQCCIQYKVSKLFYSSSACVYNMNYQGNVENIPLKEHTAYPAMPDLVYGWQKLFSEQLHQACADKLDIRIARFHNIYGPYGSYDNGKEKAPAALCRKAILAEDTIEVWGDGKQTRSFLYIDDCLDAVDLLMESDFKEPINIGSEESVSITQLAELAILFSGKEIKIKYDLNKPQGVRGRNSENTLIRNVLGWGPKYTLKEGLEKTYQWIQTKINGI